MSGQRASCPLRLLQAAYQGQPSVFTLWSREVRVSLAKETSKTQMLRRLSLRCLYKKHLGGGCLHLKELALSTELNHMHEFAGAAVTRYHRQK